MTVMLISIFVLAVFVGVEIITKVPPTLHTPLMSGANAISGITLIGAIALAGHGGESTVSKILATAALALAMINVVGGFMVTHRMLGLFKRKD
ncbi:MAG: NAD(P) transhydrogenase subunit alpha [Myxococcales bacterium]|nr:NAD(P) transhydrogenase subunit alpha [Myxococcales bacterium]